MKTERSQKLQAYLQDFLNYLSNTQRYFGTKYIFPDSEYLNAFNARAEKAEANAEAEHKTEPEAVPNAELKTEPEATTNGN